MEIEYKAIAQSEYGAPESVLRIVTRRFKNEDLGPDDVLVKVRVRPVHPGDIQILSALPQGGPAQPIPEETSRVPGFEGVGTVARLGTNLSLAKTLSEGQRVAFFPAMGSWAEYVSVPHNSLLPVPDSVPDPIAAQMLINTITASVLIKAGHNSLKAPITPPVYILQNAAASGVGRLLTQVALDRGVRPIRLVRSNQSAEKLQSVLPGPPVFSTSDSDWKREVREALGGHKLAVAFDAVGGRAIDDLAELLDEGGTIINFGSLESNAGTNIYALAPNNLALKSVSIMSWFRLPEEEKRQDFELALNLAANNPQLFEVAQEYEFDDFQRAIQHVSRPGKTGVVLLKS
jgi:NADPH:quinone reductase-like Zn-dependent oxidoreductase